MATTQELIALLVQALREPSRRLEHVKRFQELVWDTKRIGSDPEIQRMLRDVAYDLDFYEPDERARAEDPSLYGDTCLVREIEQALQRLGPGALRGIRERTSLRTRVHDLPRKDQGRAA